MRKTLTDGFTLIELLVVIIMAGILASIAAPGWLAFINRQRVGAVQDEMLQILQTAQVDAQRTNRDYNVGVTSTIGMADLTVGPETTGLKNSLGGSPVRDKLKLDAVDSNGDSISDFVFNHNGQIEAISTSTSSISLPVVISVTLDGSSVNPKCIVLTTLLGGMVSAEGDSCTTPNYDPVP